MKRFLLGLTAFILFGCALGNDMRQQTNSAIPMVALLPDLGPAPELGNKVWLNVDSPYDSRICEARSLSSKCGHSGVLTVKT